MIKRNIKDILNLLKFLLLFIIKKIKNKEFFF